MKKINDKGNGNLLYPQLSYEIVGAAMDVHNNLGPGWDEDVYHRALLHAMESRGIKAESKIRGRLKNHDRTAAQFELDILVEDLIILELKHLGLGYSASTCGWSYC